MLIAETPSGMYYRYPIDIRINMRSHERFLPPVPCRSTTVEAVLIPYFSNIRFLARFRPRAISLTPPLP